SVLTAGARRSRKGDSGHHVLPQEGGPTTTPPSAVPVRLTKCSHSWLPLLFIPTNAPPVFVFLFFVFPFFLSRPPVYFNFPPVILFLTSCHWSDRCFFDFSSNWFLPRQPTSVSSSLADDFNATTLEVFNSTVTTLIGAGADELARKKAEWTGLGMEWLRS